MLLKHPPQKLPVWLECPGHHPNFMKRMPCCFHRMQNGFTGKHQLPLSPNHIDHLHRRQGVRPGHEVEGFVPNLKMLIHHSGF